MTNILRVVWFRLGVKSGLNPVRKIKASAPLGPFWRPFPDSPAKEEASQRFLSGFGYIPIGEASPPDWHSNLLTGERCLSPEKPWYAISDFGGELGDIKGIWELSRFDWVLAFVQEYREGNADALNRLENWLEDWSKSNPPYLGPNWKCGQEASIRVMHLAMAAILMRQVESAEKSLLQLIEIHLKRIAPTIQYAIAQDNNHGTSEAAALFIGGAWLALHGLGQGKHWQEQGRKWLENRARRLIAKDGSFSQYSVTYHRVLLDTLSIVEVWRRKLSLPAFSPNWYEKAGAATDWLRAMLQPGGDVPNVGANDGARLLPLAATDYRDFRPSVQLAASLFRNEWAVPEAGEWDIPLKLLSINEPQRQAPELGSQLFDEGGYAILRSAGSFVLFRYPRFRFRPGHADALHVDLWLGDQNILRDGGSFSYNTQEPWQSYFPGLRAHNTVQFDEREPMPRISRFLFGEWLKTSSFEPLESTSGIQKVMAGYRDYLGASHKRRLVLSTGRLRIEDTVSGFSQKAVLRWRLQPGDWKLVGHVVTLGGLRIELNADVPLRRLQLVEGWESRYYGQKTPLPVLEVEVDQASRLVTDITWNLS
ncbi:heparinase II/III family protein [Marinobacter nauticus]|uniref:heparinase II/III family protein n=1 Tax=Marinobacter nauticus TaxID=2743 RepID=UPI001CFD3378|nr:heparinase II/III-family protein [Marinobacter nauticus]